MKDCIPFTVMAEIEGQNYIPRGVDYTIFTKQFEVSVPQAIIIERAFNMPSKLFLIKHTGIELEVYFQENNILRARAKIGRSQSSQRVLDRLKELGWKFIPAAAEKMLLPEKSGPLNDQFLWERLEAAMDKEKAQAIKVELDTLAKLSPADQAFLEHTRPTGFEFLKAVS